MNFISIEPVRRFKMSLKNWWGDVNRVRADWGFLYLIIGLTMLFLTSINWLFFIKEHLSNLLWISSWSFIGIGAGLINSRTNKDKDDKEGRLKQHLHYIIYYIFAFFVSSLASFALSRKENILDYPLSALIALTLGFAADKINDLAPIK